MKDLKIEVRNHAKANSKMKDKIMESKSEHDGMTNPAKKNMEEILSNTLGRDPKPSRMEETINICPEIMRRQATVQEERRTGFWRYLSDILRFEGIWVFGLQAVAFYCILCFVISTASAQNMLLFTPLFVLPTLPGLFRGQYYKMSEIEAATRASGAQIVLAKLVLAGAANLIVMTAVLCMELYFHHSGRQIIQMILYLLVPYLACMTIVLWYIRLCKREGAVTCTVFILGFYACLFISIRLLPRLYETSALGIWIAAFVIFGTFYIKEIYLLIKAGKEGKMYGIIA